MQNRKLTNKQINRLVVTIIIGIMLVTACSFLFRLLNFALTVGILTLAVTAISLAIVGIFRVESIYKFAITAMYIGLVFSIALVILDRTEFIYQFDSTDAFVTYINNSGGVAELVYFVIQFLQVTFIPIPSTITTVGATLLFPEFWKAFGLATAGLIAGSMFAFFLGKVFGSKLANWLIGEEAMRKYQEFMKGRDKIILFFMFLFPFFPDDFLCLLAGLTTMSYLGFFLMMILTRSIGTASTILMAKGVLKIPFEGWGIPIWIAIVVVVFVLFVLTIKYSAKIEKRMMQLIDKVTARKNKNEKTKAQKQDKLFETQESELEESKVIEQSMMLKDKKTKK